MIESKFGDDDMNGKLTFPLIQNNVYETLSTTSD